MYGKPDNSGHLSVTTKFLFFLRRVHKAARVTLAGGLTFFPVNTPGRVTCLPGKLFKTDSAQSSSNKCKNYLLKIYSQHINFLNTI